MRDERWLAAIRPVVIPLIVTAGLMARVATFQLPLFDHHAWRQADTATMARNYVRAGDLTSPPQIDARGARPDGQVATGLELHALVTAVVSRAAGFSVPLARIVSAFCFLGSCFFLLRLLRRRMTTGEQLVGMVTYALCLPYVIFAEHAVWNEPFLILLSFALLAFSQDLVDRRRLGSLAGAAVAAALMCAVKPQWGIMLAIVAGMFWERDGWRAIKAWGLWVIAAAAVVAIALTLVHMEHVARVTGLTFGSTDKLFNVEDMTLHYAFVVTRRLVRDIFGPVGLVCLILGLVVLVRGGRRAELFGLGGLLVYVLAVSKGVRVHDYYLLPVVPVGVMAMPAGILAASRWLAGTRWPYERVAVWLLWVLVVSSFVRSVSFHSWYEVDSDKQQFCEELVPLLQRSDLVAFADYGSPDLLFCLDHRGWLLHPDESTPAGLGEIIRQGASVLVMQNSWPARPAVAPLVATKRWLAFRVDEGVAFTQ